MEKYMSEIKKRMKRMRRDILLLVQSPREYLFSFVLSSKQKVRIGPYNPLVQKAIQNIIIIIKSQFPTLKIIAAGSSSLKIAGLNDIDLYTVSPKESFHKYILTFTRLFGKPYKIRKNFIEWHFSWKGFPVELSLMDPDTSMCKERLRIFQIFKHDKRILYEYEKLKKDLNGSSLREYVRGRLEFFNRVLKNNTIKATDTSHIQTTLVNNKRSILLRNILLRFLHRFTKFNKVASLFFFIVFCSIILALSLRGILGNPTEITLNSTFWRDSGPFELSPERGRFALTYSFIENHSLYLSLPLARFSTPDVGFKNGHYVSLFAPAISFMILPGYSVGKLLGMSQVGSFAVIAFFGLLNAILIRKIAIKLGAGRGAATIAAFAFLFGSPAFSYAVSLYQHHISTFLILMSLYAVIAWDSIWSLALIWFLCALSPVVDNPNVFFMLPIGIFALGKIIYVRVMENSMTIKIKIVRILSFAVMIIPFVFFFWFNTHSYGSPFQLAGTVLDVSAINAKGKPTLLQLSNVDKGLAFEKKKSAVGFFLTRNMINGAYILLLSPDRGVLWFTPIMFLSIWGAIYLYKKNSSIASLLIAIIGINILLYMMWGDPWGGWAFGARYLIPSYALCALFLAFTVETWKKHLIFLLVFFLPFAWSLSVNTIGALTSNSNPPQIQVPVFEKISGKVEKYTYERDLDLLKEDHSKSFVWQFYLKDKISAMNYYVAIYTILLLSCLILMAGVYIRKEHT